MVCLLFPLVLAAHRAVDILGGERNLPSRPSQKTWGHCGLELDTKWAKSDQYEHSALARQTLRRGGLATTPRASSLRAQPALVISHGNRHGRDHSLSCGREEEKRTRSRQEVKSPTSTHPLSVCVKYIYLSREGGVFFFAQCRLVYTYRAKRKDIRFCYLLQNLGKRIIYIWDILEYFKATKKENEMEPIKLRKDVWNVNEICNVIKIYKYINII